MKNVRISPGTFFYQPLKAYITVSPRSSSRRFRMWWKSGAVMITAPASATVAELHDALVELSPALLDKRPAPLYSLGQRIEFKEGTISLLARSDNGRVINCTTSRDESGRYLVNLNLPADIDFTDPTMIAAVSRTICQSVKWIAHLSLIPYATSVASETGRNPEGWAISHGHRVLGSCDRRGIIRLSHVLLFLPEELRRYVVCHELAHLSEMNHSPRFHALLDKYLGGREKELMARLKAFRWPVVR